MKKKLVITLLTLFIYAQNSLGVVAAVTYFFNPASAASLALTGLASPVAGIVTAWVLSKERGCDGGNCSVGFVLGTMLGLILLDDNSPAKFEEISLQDGKKLNLSNESIEIFNSEVTQVNILLEEVSSKLTKSSTPQDARHLWMDIKENISPETFQVMQTIINNTQIHIEE